MLFIFTKCWAKMFFSQWLTVRNTLLLVQILLAEIFDCQLTFYRVLFVNACYGIYKLKSLEICLVVWNVRRNILTINKNLVLQNIQAVKCLMREINQIWNQILWMIFLFYFIYEKFKLFLWLGRYHKNTVHLSLMGR